MAKTSQPKKNKPRPKTAQLSKEIEAKPGSFSGLSVDAFLLLDENLNLLSINDAGQKMFGVSKAGVFGKCILDVIPDIKNTGIYKKYRHALKTGKSIAVHLELGGRHLSVQLFKQGDALGMIAADITEHKRMEEALLKSEARYRKLYESSRDGIAAADLDGRITECNQAYSEMLGYSREELKEIGYLEITPSKWHARNEAYARQVMGWGYSDDFEKEYIRKDGTVFPVSLCSWRTDDEAGNPVGVWSIVRDITKRKRMEEALRESEEKYRNLFSNAQVGLFRSRVADGKIIECNDLLAKMFGYQNREECIARHITSEHYVDPNVRDQELAQMQEKGKVEKLEALVTRKDGSPFWISYSATIYHESDCIEGVVIDITERKKAEEALRESEQRFRLLYERAPFGCQSLNEEGYFIEVNQAWLDLLGYSREEVIGRWFGDFLAPGYEEHLKKNFSRFKATGEIHGVEYEMPRKDGSMVTVAFDGRIGYDEHGKFKQTHCILQNITGRKRMEEEIRASLKEKEALLSEVNHRVKNNFQLISSLLDMTGMRARNEETIRLCASVHARVHAMGLIHSQLYQSGSFAQIDMEAHVKELVGYLAQVYATNGRRINPVIDASGVYLSITQAVPCALVLNEVISNAFKHAFPDQQKGTIEISLRKSAEGMVTMRVKDDGIGMPEDFDIDKTSTLGLKLTRNLVQEQLKGSIQFRRGNGTEVIIEFKVG